MTETRPAHTIRLPYGAISYWRDGVAAKASDDWSEARVEGFMGYPRMKFAQGENRAMDQLLEFLEKAYAAGAASKADEICRALGVRP